MRWYYTENRFGDTFIEASELDVVLVEWALMDAIEIWLSSNAVFDSCLWGAL